MAIISTSHLSKRYANGTAALNGVSLALEAGQFTVILGPSGSGKSTLLRLFNGLETPTEGSVSINGTVLQRRNLRHVRREVGMVFQHFNLVGRLNVMTNVLIGRLAYRSWLGSMLHLFREEDFRIAHEALARVGLAEKAWVRADQLSGGQQQRVGIARALAQRPRVILADEPVASLDPVTSTEVLGLLKQICREDGIAVVANLHQPDYTHQYADRVIGLNSGRVIFDDAPGQLTDNRLQTIYHRDSQPQETRHAELALAHA
ncbi:phosphonate transport system ATP-binding protein [Thiothrix caldifontis]|uniref:Phosphonate transport system ATP-binding protein n=1 Tax=Thiothrix caldifontis TaxID=525918 RepID=A0A1H4GAU3_9GAMM|nr:phosphonate ABC transporter ATP-binding protein [Thiothrix caldifontis]SEB06381.1 phosphonate transport system ATP-binding protein [Thiothrix caldifontis]